MGVLLNTYMKQMAQEEIAAQKQDMIHSGTNFQATKISGL